MSIYQKLQEIRKRPGMYLGKKSIKLLKSYMDGYIDGYQESKRDMGGISTKIFKIIYKIIIE
jgi:hypothetical protein